MCSPSVLADVCAYIGALVSSRSIQIEADTEAPMPTRLIHSILDLSTVKKAKNKRDSGVFVLSCLRFSSQHLKA